MSDRVQYTVLKVIASLLGTGVMTLAPVCQAAPFYPGPLWDAHSHVDEWTAGDGSTKRTKASKIAIAINGVAAGTTIYDGTKLYELPQDLPGAECILLFPKKGLNAYMLDDLATASSLQNRLITGIGFQDGGWKNYTPPEGGYDPAGDTFLNDVETLAAGGDYRWLGEVALYGKGIPEVEVKADLFDGEIKKRILRVLDIAANYDLPVTIHHTVTDTAGGPICDLVNPPTSPEECPETAETAAERFLSILQEHVDVYMAVGEAPATVIWTHWGGLSTKQEIETMIDEFDNLYFDLAWFHKGLTAYQPDGVPNPPLNSNCNNIENLEQCGFTDDWKLLLSSNPERFLAGMDAGKNSAYEYDYRVRELILRTALGGLNTTDAKLIASDNLLKLLGPVDGNINLDCMVNVGDVLLGLQVLGGSAILSPLQMEHGDVAPLVSGKPVPDGLFNLGDLQVTLRKILNLN